MVKSKNYPFKPLRKQLFDLFFTKSGERFKRLEYLVGTGTQYIDTGKVFDTENEYFVSFRQPRTDSSNIMGYLGCAGDSCEFWIDGFSQNNSYVNVKFSDTTNRQNIYINYKREWFTINKSKVIHHNESGMAINANYKASPTPGRSEKNIYLFKCNGYEGGSSEHISPELLIYEYSVVKDGVTIQHLVPCYDNNLRKPCFFDIITETPYYNAGTGEFILPSTMYDFRGEEDEPIDVW